MASLPQPVSVILFLFLVLTFVLETKADKALVDGICKESQDFQFCTKSLYGDRRTYNANLNDLATISTTLALDQVRQTSDRIPGIAGGIKDPVGKKRIGVCQSSYQFAVLRYQAAFEFSSRRSYYDVVDQVTQGTDRVIECENIYRKDGPISVSPVTVDNHNVIKLNEIIFIIVGRLLQH